ncbi:ArsR/SmtB family transcription factor [Devosia sp. A16]|uniref:ArsR/SmtB family transcription factor n=1 Tax=Devosia sp. A16 TaxID=1736675 RepID=UPI0006D7F9C0|nr:helix-turn-helix transcriptional regulator [Devosia sp. A16]
MQADSAQLDGIFQALADPTRRAILTQLGHGPAAVGELAKPFDMALPSFMKHVAALEQSGLIRTSKSGRVRTCTLERGTFALVDRWLGQQRRLWSERTDRLEAFVTRGDT